MAEGQKWHRGSRFYRVGGWALGLAFALATMVIFKAPEAIPEALGMFGGVAFALLAGGGAVNYRERMGKVAD